MAPAAPVTIAIALAVAAATPAAAQVAASPPVLDGGGRGFVVVPRGPGPAAATPSHILYVNNCWPAGCVVTPGNLTAPDDARADVSAIVSGTNPRTLRPYSGSLATWQAIVACVRENYAPFDVTVVTEDPGPVPHFEAMAAGLPGDLGFPSAVTGVASFTCDVIPNAMSFSFLNRRPADVYDACWTISQESAHSFGLSHELLPGDAMTYAPNPPRKRFVDERSCIGTQGCCQPAAECMCGATEQNTVAALRAVFGPAPAAPPAVTILAPAAGAAVVPGFTVRAEIIDADGVAGAELAVDDAPVQTLTGGPYVFIAPVSLARGPHTLAVRAVDGGGAVTTATRVVTVGDPCTDDAACAVVGAGYRCVDARCVPGGDVDGGLGAACRGPDDCLSGQCATRGDASRCTEPCTLARADSCGEDFACVDVGADQGRCWPEDAAGCGCASGDDDAPLGALGAGLVLAALTRRRRAEARP
ncbi:MAG: MYXO-CTERM sorting domain-containing protein [Myxococcales bacterium]|nr:MYXO-CTERM sorting domain-containing protein [Myxococcales bacterium]